MCDGHGIGLAVAEDIHEALDVGQQVALVIHHGRQDLVGHHVAKHAGLDLELHHVVLELDLGAGRDLLGGEHAHAVEQVDHFLALPHGEGARRVEQVGQSALGGLVDPLLTVAVAFEANGLALLDELLDLLEEGFVLLVSPGNAGVDGGLEHVQLLGHDRVEHGHRNGAVGRTAHGTELELVAGEGKRRGPVAVGVVEQHFRDAADLELHGRLLVRAHLAGGHVLLDGVEQLGQLGPDEGADDGRRCLIGSETVIVSGAGNGGAQDVGMTVDGRDRVHEEGQEAQIGLRVGARLEQVDPGVGSEGPVVVLSGPVEPGERLLMHQHAEVVALGHRLEQLHQEQVVVIGQVGLLEHRSHLELVWRHLVVAGGDRDAQFVGLAFEVLHEGHHAGRNAAEVVVIQLLPLGRGRAKQGASALAQVRTGIVEGLVDQEVLLLPAEGGDHLGDVLVEVLADVRGGLVYGREGLEEWRLVVEGLARVGDEDGGDAEGGAHDERGTARIPEGVTAGLESGADAAVGKAGGIGLLLDEEAAVEALDGAAAAVGLDEAVVLLGRAASQRLEPVRVVRGAAGHGPLLQRAGHLVGNLAVDADAVLCGGHDVVIGLLREVLAHGAEREGMVAVVLGDFAGRRLRSLGGALEDILDGSDAISGHGVSDVGAKIRPPPA